MRFGARYCGRGHRRAPGYNSSYFFVSIALVAGAVLFLTFAI